eukprot:7242815-Prymnesium_polylepis.1
MVTHVAAHQTKLTTAPIMCDAAVASRRICGAPAPFVGAHHHPLSSACAEFRTFRCPASHCCLACACAMLLLMAWGSAIRYNRYGRFHRPFRPFRTAKFVRVCSSRKPICYG